MSGNNLIRAEATERARLLTVDGYVVDWDLTTGETEFDSTTQVTFGCSEPGASTFIELIAASVTSIELNGTAMDPATAVAGNRITLDGLRAENVLRVVARCIYSRSGEGLHRFVDPVDKEVYVYSQFETADAKRAYACFDQPDLKGTFSFAVTTQSHWQVVSNEPIARATSQSKKQRLLARSNLPD